MGQTALLPWTAHSASGGYDEIAADASAVYTFCDASRPGNARGTQAKTCVPLRRFAPPSARQPAQRSNTTAERSP